MTAFQRALRDMTTAIYAAAKAAREEGNPDAVTLTRMALASDEMEDRNAPQCSAP